MSRLDLTDPAELREARAEIERLRQWFAELEATNAELNVEVSRLYACRNELQDVTQAMDDPSVNNSRSLEDAIHAMKARLSAADALLRDARPQIVGNVGAWRSLRGQSISDLCNEACSKGITEGLGLLARIDTHLEPQP